MDEVKTEEVKQDSFLDQVRKEREAFEKVREDNRKLVEELKDLRAKEIISGRGDAGQAPEKQVELEPKEYMEAWRRGVIKGKLPGT